MRLLACDADVISVECHLHALMCSVCVVTVVFIHTMEDDQRLNTLVHEGDTLHFSIAGDHCILQHQRITRDKATCSSSNIILVRGGSMWLYQLHYSMR